MTANEVWEAASRQFAKLGYSFVGPLSFVDEAEVNDYAREHRLVVRRADLFTLEDARAWKPFLEPKPSWIHVNFVINDGDTAIFSVSRSSGSPEPWYQGPSAANTGGPSSCSVTLE